MFAGFATRCVKTSDAEIFLRHAGSGPGVLLIHGYPQAHAVDGNQSCEIEPPEEAPEDVLARLEPFLERVLLSR
jgi:pimeloyl-ACP methyl ester carboxylesterase